MGGWTWPNTKQNRENLKIKTFDREPLQKKVHNEKIKMLTSIRLWVLGIYTKILHIYFSVVGPMYNRLVKSAFLKGDIKINGDRPWDMKVNDNRFYVRLAHQVIGTDPRALGESYMDGDWDCDRLDEFTVRLIANG